MKPCVCLSWLFYLHLISLFLSPPNSHAFLSVNPTTRVYYTVPSKYFSSLPNNEFDSSSNNNNNNKYGQWKLANDFPQFLNQCAIQSFLFILRGLRDPQTIRWMDNFTYPVYFNRTTRSNRLTGTTAATTAITSEESVANPNGQDSTRLLTYHGLGVMNTTQFPTWDSYFEQLLKQPTESFLVQSYNGLSRDYEIDINPPSLCSRLISVREQIAAEFANDLGAVANTMGQHILDSYWSYLDNQKDYDDDHQGIGSNGDESTTRGASTSSEEVTMSSGADASRKLPPHNLNFLDYSLDGSDQKSSPIRKGNFDLLVLLATQESVHRILNRQTRNSNNNDNSLLGDQGANDFNMVQKYLLDFYMARFESHFCGIQRYGRADDFLEELLFSSPRMSLADGGSALVNPVQLVELLLEERKHVALEWQAMAKDAPNAHITIKRLQLDQLMQSYNTNSNNDESTSSSSRDGLSSIE